MINEIKQTILKNNEAYLYDFVSSCKIIITTRIPTLAINNKNELYINQKYVKSLQEKEIIGVLYHEALHIVFKHVISKGEPYLINIAGDIYINELLIKTGITLPENCLIKKVYNIPNNINTAQDIYDWLEQNLPEQTKEIFSKAFDNEQKEIGSDEIDETSEELNDIVKDIYDDFLEKYKEKNVKTGNQVIPWNIDLTIEIGRLIKRVEQKNYLRPARCEVEGLLLPQYQTVTRVPLIHLYIDTSGSMCNTLSIVTSTIIDIKKRLKQFNAKYFGFNTEVYSVDECDLGSLVANGGTEFKEVVGGADLHVIITDGELDFGYVDSHKNIIVYLCDGMKIVRRIKK